MTTWLVPALAGWGAWLVAGPAGRWPWRVALLVRERPPRSNRIEPTRRRVARRSPSHAERRAGRGPRPPRRGWRSPPGDLVEVIDRLHVAVSAGHSLHTAVGAVAALGDGPAARAVDGVAAEISRGRPLADALARLTDELGPAAVPMVAVLTTALHSGSAPGPALQRLADTERRRLRRHAEARVRRLPVWLLGPLIALVLPSFVVVTIVPVAVTTARAGLLPASP